MASINELIRKSVNPFAPETFKPGNFWHEHQDSALHVDEIHQTTLRDVEAWLEKVARDRTSRTLLLCGDSGSGKSHLLGRLKTTLNPKAFFVYIDPFPDSSCLWQHVLRSTVDSLTQVPEGASQSQLLRWLHSLSAAQASNVVDWVLGERRTFIRRLRAAYPSGIYNASQFFGVLYDLLNPDLNALACDWLRGDDLDEPDLKKLRVKRSINTEDAAQKILANFGQIAAETQPIVLCFDQLDNIARLDDGRIDLQALFDFNSSLHNQGWKNFLIVISIITSTWKQHVGRLQPADVARIDGELSLKAIPLELAKSLWAARLKPLHRRAKPKPKTAIAPLTRSILEQKFPGGKTHPRNALELGRRLIQNYKVGGKLAEEDPLAAFHLIWLKELDKTRQRVERIRQFSDPELIQMLREALLVFEMDWVRSRFLPSPTYATHSLCYERPNQSGRTGIAWSEAPNLTSFYHVMNACRRAVKLNLCQQLFLIRQESVGGEGRKGYEIYQQIFSQGTHQHLTPTLADVEILATYHGLVNAAYSGELVVAGKTPNPEELADLAHQSTVLEACSLLQALDLFPTAPPQTASAPFADLDAFLWNLLKTQQIMGLQRLIETTQAQFPRASAEQIQQQLERLCQAQPLQVLGSSDRPDEQVVCLAANSA